MTPNTFGFCDLCDRDGARMLSDCVLQEMFNIMCSKIKNQNVPFFKRKMEFSLKIRTGL